MVYTVLLVSEVILSAALITLILMQHGKGADAGAAFGSGASGTVFGAKGATNFLSRTTAILATAFFINCLMLAYIVSSRQDAGSVMDSAAVEAVDGNVAVDMPASAPIATDMPAPAVDIPAVPTALDVPVPAAPVSDVPAAADAVKDAAESVGKAAAEVKLPDVPAPKLPEDIPK